MVVESLINPFNAEKRPWEVFFIGFFYAALAGLLSLWIFREYSSMIMVFLTVMTSIPLVYSTLKFEESKDMEIEGEVKLLEEHGKALAFLMFLFVGFTLAFASLYVFLPSNYVVDLFSSQINTIKTINSQVVGAYTLEFSTFLKIFLNNIKVLTFCILFAFIYGLGAIFILTWNASVLGAAIGNFIKTHISSYAAQSGFTTISVYMHALSLSLVRYFIHGIPEMAAYFIGGLAGGIISIAVIRKHFRSAKFEKIVFDSSNLILISIVLLLVSALIEVYVTPFVFNAVI